MTDPETILRIAAKGDGVTAQGRHVSGGVPGDVIEADGILTPGPHHAAPPCRHFPVCGGCQLQHADDEALRQFVTERVMYAAEGQRLAAAEMLPTHLSPPRTRRRATLHGLRRARDAALGFREAGSHRIVDMRECHILQPEIFALVAPLRALIAERGGKRSVDVALTLADQGVDCAIAGIEVEGLGPTEAVLDAARELGLARLGIDQGYGPETLWEPEPVTVTLAGVTVALPRNSFLQPTKDGEAVLVRDACDFLAGAATIADLFSGLGTFALALGSADTKILAVEAKRDAHLACKAAANTHRSSVRSLHRDLFRNPLQPEEIDRFDAVLLDPPRAGAKDQIATIAASSVSRVAYVSCNPSSWARDAKTLTDAGFGLEKLRPVGQFRWSTHVELTSYFTR